jgi:hypothetical protein
LGSLAVSVACRSLDDGRVRLGFSIVGVERIGEGVTGEGDSEGEEAIAVFGDGAEYATRKNKIGSD